MAFDSKAAAKKMLVNMSSGKVDFIDDLLADDYEFNGKPSSKAGNKAWLAGLHRRYPNLEFSAETILSEGPLVGMHWKLQVHNFPENRPGCIRGTNILTFNDEGRLASIVQDDRGGRHHFHPAGGGDPILIPEQM